MSALPMTGGELHVCFLSEAKFYHRDGKMLCLRSPMSSVEQLDLSVLLEYYWVCVCLTLETWLEGNMGTIELFQRNFSDTGSPDSCSGILGKYMVCSFSCLRNDDSSLQTFLCHSLYWLVGRLSGFVAQFLLQWPKGVLPLGLWSVFADELECLVGL